MLLIYTSIFNNNKSYSIVIIIIIIIIISILNGYSRVTRHTNTMLYHEDAQKGFGLHLINYSLHFQVMFIVHTKILPHI